MAEKKEVKEAVASEAKVVAIKAMQSHECTIAGVKYAFAKGEDLEVPECVAVILAHSGIAMKK